MFTRTINIDKQVQSSNQNLKVGEFFELIKTRNQDKIKEYFLIQIIKYGN